MPVRTDVFDLGALRLLSGEGRRLELSVGLGDFAFAQSSYRAVPDPVAVVLDISRTTAHGYALRLRLEASLRGPCMRCLAPADREFAVDAREVELPGGGDELESPYVEGEKLDLRQWAHDAYALAQQLVCREDCAGLCADCGTSLNEDPGHEHERAPDPRWAKLRELKLDS